MQVLQHMSTSHFLTRNGFGEKQCTGYSTFTAIDKHDEEEKEGYQITAKTNKQAQTIPVSEDSEIGETG